MNFFHLCFIVRASSLFPTELYVLEALEVFQIA